MLIAKTVPRASERRAGLRMATLGLLLLLGAVLALTTLGHAAPPPRATMTPAPGVSERETATLAHPLLIALRHLYPRDRVVLWDAAGTGSGSLAEATVVAAVVRGGRIRHWLLGSAGASLPMTWTIEDPLGGASGPPITEPPGPILHRAIMMGHLPPNLEPMSDVTRWPFRSYALVWWATASGWVVVGTQSGLSWSTYLVVPPRPHRAT